jgi:hypothetical protein
MELGFEPKEYGVRGYAYNHCATLPPIELTRNSNEDMKEVTMSTTQVFVALQRDTCAG